MNILTKIMTIIILMVILRNNNYEEYLTRKRSPQKTLIEPLEPEPSKYTTIKIDTSSEPIRPLTNDVSMSYMYDPIYRAYIRDNILSASQGTYNTPARPYYTNINTGMIKDGTINTAKSMYIKPFHNLDIR